MPVQPINRRTMLRATGGALVALRYGGLLTSRAEAEDASSILEGYASRTSAFPGEDIAFHVRAGGEDNRANTKYKIRIFRWPDPDTTLASIDATAYPQTTSNVSSVEGCGWTESARLRIPMNWRSGVYFAALNVPQKATSSYVMFVVRPRPQARRARILLKSTVNTFQAYNNWAENGSYYSYNQTPGAISRKMVSFDRPYERLLDLPLDALSPQNSFQAWEAVFIRFAEGEGIPIEYCTDVDVHTDPHALDGYQLLLSVGHDEYWSSPMRTHVEEFLAGGGNAAFFSGNTCFYEVSFPCNARQMKGRYEWGRARTEESFTCGTDDPGTASAGGWTDARGLVHTVPRPENTLIGVGFDRVGGRSGWATVGTTAQDPVRQVPYTVVNPDHWVFEGTKLADNDTFGDGCGILGYETDVYQSTLGPAGFVPLAEFEDLTVKDANGKWVTTPTGAGATMGIFRYGENEEGGTVFTASTTGWTFGLGPKAHGIATLPDCPEVRKITENVLKRLSTRQVHRGTMTGRDGPGE